MVLIHNYYFFVKFYKGDIGIHIVAFESWARPPGYAINSDLELTVETSIFGR
jgi:hypothetical protein